MKIDFVSDVACPWCAVGLNALERALERIGDDIDIELHFQPFELNPQMPPEGEDTLEHLTRKYGASPTQLAQTRENLRQRGAELGFIFDMDKRRRVYNTFDSHRLLHWAGEQGQAPQKRLKHALLQAYFTDGRDISDLDTLVAVAGEAGLDSARARRILESDEFVEAVRTQERFYVEQGITAVPSVIFNDRHLIQGGQPIATFETMLRTLANLPATPALD